jgi:hypothetical protein
MLITPVVIKENEAGTYVVVFVIYVGTVVVTLRKYLVFFVKCERELNAHVAVFVCSFVVVVGTVVVTLDTAKISKVAIGFYHSLFHQRKRS